MIWLVWLIAILAFIGGVVWGEIFHIYRLNKFLRKLADALDETGSENVD